MSVDRAVEPETVEGRTVVAAVVGVAGARDFVDHGEVEVDVLGVGEIGDAVDPCPSCILLVERDIRKERKEEVRL